jgi:hypothetical protein
MRQTTAETVSALKFVGRLMNASEANNCFEESLWCMAADRARLQALVLAARDEALAINA